MSSRVHDKRDHSPSLGFSGILRAIERPSCSCKTQQRQAPRKTTTANAPTRSSPFRSQDPSTLTWSKAPPKRPISDRTARQLQRHGVISHHPLQTARTFIQKRDTQLQLRANLLPESLQRPAFLALKCKLPLCRSADEIFTAGMHALSLAVSQQHGLWQRVAEHCRRHKLRHQLCLLCVCSPVMRNFSEATPEQCWPLRSTA
jgi:hypothetical protein